MSSTRSHTREYMYTYVCVWVQILTVYTHTQTQTHSRHRYIHEDPVRRIRGCLIYDALAAVVGAAFRIGRSVRRSAAQRQTHAVCSTLLISIDFGSGKKNTKTNTITTDRQITVNTITVRSPRTQILLKRRPCTTRTTNTTSWPEPTRWSYSNTITIIRTIMEPRLCRSLTINSNSTTINTTITITCSSNSSRTNSITKSK